MDAVAEPIVVGVGDPLMGAIVQFVAEAEADIRAADAAEADAA